MSNETYISIDIESDGPIPGPNSMLSIGAAAFDLAADNPLEPIDTFECNLETLRGAAPDPSTATWWEAQPEAWEYCRKDPQDPGVAMLSFVKWASELPGRPVMVCYPEWDFAWVFWYVMRFGGVDRSPFGLGCYSIKSLAAQHLSIPWHKSSKRRMPKRWFSGPEGRKHPHTHKALDDAIGQGHLFVNLRQEIRS